MAFEDSKGVQRKGAPERVRLQDTNLIRILVARRYRAAPEDKVFRSSYAAVSVFLRQAGDLFELPSARLTSHCMRRGGATFMFREHGSHDRVAQIGRWASMPTCRRYIEDGAAALAALRLDVLQVQQLTSLGAVLRQWAQRGFPD